MSRARKDVRWLSVMAVALCAGSAGQEFALSMQEPETRESQVSEKPEPRDDPPRPRRDLPPELEAKLPKLEEIQARPAVAIPDNPPPHEGALIDIPVTVGPPDLILVEVFGALPGRPITGDRLVRPDGTLTLGFYGDVHVRGLTLAQVKTKIILHLRQFLDDESLGLVAHDFQRQLVAIAPENSDRVLVDIAAYNQHVYYVQGEVNAPGRLPFTGRETVLDAINYAGQLTSAGNPKDIILARPSPNNQPPKHIPIDLESIQRGDKTANLQLFPNDRLIIGRTPAAPSTTEKDY